MHIVVKLTEGRTSLDRDYIDILQQGRKFKIYLNTALELEVYDEKDKKLKTLPAVGAKASNAEFKQMKKQLCLQIDAGQSMRGKAFSKQMNKKNGAVPKRFCTVFMY